MWKILFHCKLLKIDCLHLVLKLFGWMRSRKAVWESFYRIKCDFLFKFSKNKRIFIVAQLPQYINYTFHDSNEDSCSLFFKRLIQFLTILPDIVNDCVCSNAKKILEMLVCSESEIFFFFLLIFCIFS